MEKLCALTSCLLLRVAASQAQSDSVTPVERPLPQWLTGIIAVAGFLFLAFVVFLVKRAWCEDPDSRNSSTKERVTNIAATEENSYETLDLDLEPGRRKRDDVYENSLDLVRNKEELNTFSNRGFDSSEEKVTPM